MELVFLIGFGAFPERVISESPVFTPDEEALYEEIEDSLAQLEQGGFSFPREYRLLMRVASDSPAGKLAATKMFIRARAKAGDREAVCVIEKDPGERNVTDFVGGGVAFAVGKGRLTLGDFLLGFGRGLLFTTPAARAGFRWNLESESKKGLALSALENRNLRGVRFDHRLGKIFTTFFGSYSLRDARLNPDGSVARQVFSGVHDDSAAQEEKNQLGQRVAGALVNYQAHGMRCGLAGYGVCFDRRFAPADSTWSFYGDALGGAGVFFGLRRRSSAGEVELARSLPGGGAAAVRLGVDTAGFRAQFSAAVYQARFFAPLGRVYSLTNRRSKFEAGGRIGYNRAGLKIGFSGNTHRDYLTDSIPGRLGIDFAYESPALQWDGVLRRIYRGERERAREARLQVTTRWRFLKLGVLVADEYAEVSEGRGFLLGLNVRTESRTVKTSIAATRCFVSGNGVTVSVLEPGVMRLGSTYTLREGGWRFSITGDFRMRKVGRAGAKLGCTKTDRWRFDIGLQLEMGVQCD